MNNSNNEAEPPLTAATNLVVVANERKETTGAERC